MKSQLVERLFLIFHTMKTRPITNSKTIALKSEINKCQHFLVWQYVTANSITVYYQMLMGMMSDSRSTVGCCTKETLIQTGGRRSSR